MDNSAWLGLIYFVAAFTQGVSGFGFGLVAMPLLLLFFEARMAVPLCMLNGLVITLFLSLRLRENIDWQKIRPLFLGCLPGIIIGALFLRRADNVLIQILLGVLLIAYASFALFLSPRPRRMGLGWPLLAGFGTGVIGSAFSAGGPPVIIYTTLTGWAKDEIKATLSVFFFITGIGMAAAHYFAGLTNMAVLVQFRFSVIFVAAGMIAGSVCYGRISRVVYVRVILWMLLGMGWLMVWSAFS